MPLDSCCNIALVYQWKRCHELSSAGLIHTVLVRRVVKVGVMWGDALVRMCAAEPVLSCGQLRGHAVRGRRLTTWRHATHCNTIQSSSRRGSICVEEETVKREEKRTYGLLMKESLTKATICTGRTTHILHSALKLQ